MAKAKKILRLELIFALVAIGFPFAIVPAYQILFKSADMTALLNQIQAHFQFQMFSLWKASFTLFLALNCGYLIVRALR